MTAAKLPKSEMEESLANFTITSKCTCEVCTQKFYMKTGF